MLIIDNKALHNPLPVYEVQEVSMKEALALLKADLRNVVDPLAQHAGAPFAVISRSATEHSEIGSSSL